MNGLRVIGIKEREERASNLYGRESEEVGVGGEGRDMCELNARGFQAFQLLLATWRARKFRHV